MGHSYGSAARQSVGRGAADYSLVCAVKGIWQHTPEAPRPETPCQLSAQSCRATCPDRARTTAVAHQGVWHDRGKRATSEGVTLAAVWGHRFGRSVAPPAWVRGATPVCERGWWVDRVAVSVGLAWDGA